MKGFCLCCKGRLVCGFKYCSNKCQKEYEWQLRKKEIEITKVFKKTFNGKDAKHYLREEKGEKCSICLLEEWMGKPIPLVLDHIDGNSDNWALENVRLVCGNCDMQLDTYKNKNRGKGRFWRRKRYHSKMSY